ncbi:hypothetical protein [Methylocucumis oryzae]|uniref:hypothetical protein n=1 Tax=Methylocucumis oryzae TaxID=1632867 RepID=UPI0006967FA6|nr:hypothetical protein [Methylocucumis oryzae]
MRFGLACEGVTDQAVIQNILCGYFDAPNLDEDITALQPPFDETSEKQLDGGGWSILFKYLASSRFRDDVLNTGCVIVQIDSDIAEQIPIARYDTNGNELATEILIANMTAELVARIDNSFYAANADKIIFAICVHSLECWLVAYYGAKAITHDCYDALSQLVIRDNHRIIRLAKKHKNYNQLSQPFLQRQNVA